MNVKQCDVVLLPVPLTSVIKDVQYSLIVTQKSFAEGELITTSRARADKIFTAHKSLIKMKIGKIKSSVLAEIRQKIIKVV